ncbi:Gustatory receptor [Nesidiocoris tenuis]|uniref:Gustatory receptor n=1 Tax=Nesidiocoris tenuis TaxID=355587 RepID=A0ABN7AUI5_9HEMI|nr:Gustatory receptor [Nesidiocoris tenuis]
MLGDYMENRSGSRISTNTKMYSSQRTKSLAYKLNFSKSHHLPPYLKDPAFFGSSKDSAQKMMIPAMIVAQFGCIFPVSGKLQTDVKRLRFDAWSANCIISLLIIASSSILAIIPFLEFWDDRDLSYDMARRVVYGVTSTLYMVGFFSLACHWRDVMMNWEAVEGRMANFKPVNATLKIIVCTIVFMTFSTCEHILSYRVQDTFSIKEYFLWSFRTLFKRTEYALWKGYLASLTNGFMVIAWNFTDLFLGVVSMALSSAFDQFNLELESSVKRKVHRLLLEVIIDQISFSGYNFFYITKSLLLKIAGTILTCEICLVQLEAMKSEVHDAFDSPIDDDFYGFPNRTNGNFSGS